MACCPCRGEGDPLRGSILYSILNRGAPRRGSQPEAAGHSVRLDTLDTLDTRRGPRLLRAALTRRRRDTWAGIGDPGVPAGAAEGIQMFLARCSRLRMSVRELALVRGAILPPELKELECGDCVQELHREAHRALHEHVRVVCGDQAGPLGRLRGADPEAVAGLLFGPVAGSSNVEERVVAMLEHQSGPDSSSSSSLATTERSDRRIHARIRKSHVCV